MSLSDKCDLDSNKKTMSSYLNMVIILKKHYEYISKELCNSFVFFLNSGNELESDLIFNDDEDS